MHRCFSSTMSPDANLAESLKRFVLRARSNYRNTAALIMANLI
jgi:hypothetical protein